MKLVRIRRFVAMIAALPVLLAGVFAQAAANPGIRDQAGFFSESAQKEATRVVSEIRSSHKRDLVIETYREIPAEIRGGVDLKDKAAVKRLFETWSGQRARELGVQGIYVVLTREPSHLEVAVGNETLRQSFTAANRDALVGTMIERLRAKKFDEALTSGVGFVRDTLAAHQAGGPASTRPSAARRSEAGSAATTERIPAASASSAEAPAGGGGFSFFALLVPLLIVGVVVLLIIRLIGRLFSRGGASGMQPGLGGGGGFLQSALGGLFGAAAGMWLYNQFTGHGSAFGGENPPTSDGHSDIAGGQDTDYSSSGGDFGGDSGGGDFGGGGGGDFGGGGGDF